MLTRNVQAVSSDAILVGQDTRGQWVMRDGRNRFGGFFRNRADAVRFAMTAGGATAVLMMPGQIDLSTGG